MPAPSDLAKSMAGTPANTSKVPRISVKAMPSAVSSWVVSASW